MHPRDLSISSFSYHLPEENIAYYPLPERDASRLLIYKEKIIAEDIYRNIAEYIPADALVVFNNTRVVEARIQFQKTTGGEIEIFCLEPGPEYPDIASAMLKTGMVRWICLIGGASKWKAGQVLAKQVATEQDSFTLSARYLEKKPGAFLVELSWDQPSLSFAEVLHLAGIIPLPPYIKRKVEEKDAERYQTVFAKEEGSVAAPTAGLHFTENVLQSFHQKNIGTAFTTLHVGAGTFQPVKSDRMEGHPMHAEYIEIDYDLISKLISHGNKPLIAVGTTSLRTLESIYWMGVQAIEGILDPEKGLDQWEAYDSLPHDYPVELSLKALQTWMQSHQMQKLVTRTRILIAPGYRIRMIRGLVTNFHQPASTLLLLVASLIGPSWKEMYEEAIRRGFRFLSYGDGCLIWRSENC